MITFSTPGSTSSMVSRYSRFRVISGAFWYSRKMARKRSASPRA